MSECVHKDSDIVGEIDGMWSTWKELAHIQRARFFAAERALRDIGNLVGGPTMTYAPSVEIQEWRKRADKISELVSGAVRAENQHSGKPE